MFGVGWGGGTVKNFETGQNGVGGGGYRYGSFRSAGGWRGTVTVFSVSWTLEGYRYGIFDQLEAGGVPLRGTVTVIFGQLEAGGVSLRGTVTVFSVSWRLEGYRYGIFGQLEAGGVPLRYFRSAGGWRGTVTVIFGQLEAGGVPLRLFFARSARKFWGYRYAL